MLYVVGTPIGNLEDISLRAIRILRSVDLVLCEDTRVTRRLLEHYEIKTPFTSYHEHSSDNKIKEILGWLRQGKNLALVTDAGTPGISDPGGKLVYEIICAQEEDRDGKQNFQVESVPGPSAITAALSISGIPTDKFVFMGFPPHKKGRQKFIKKILESEWPVAVYESKHRIIKFLEELEKLSESKLTSVVVCRELSKMHETVYRGEIERIIKTLTDNPQEQKGEFVVIIGK